MIGMMTLYMDDGDTLRAVKVAEGIVNKPVKVPSFRVDQIKAAAHQLLSDDIEKPKQCDK